MTRYVEQVLCGGRVDVLPRVRLTADDLAQQLERLVSQR